MQSTFFLDVVIGQGATIFQLFACEDQPLLVGRDSLFVLYLSFYVVNRVASLHVKGNRLAGQGLDEDLHSTSKAKDQMQSTFFLDIVVRQGAPVFQLFACKDQPLLVGWNSLFVLDLSFYVVDRVASLHIKGNSLAGQGLHENLHSTSKAKDQMQSTLFLDI